MRISFRPVIQGRGGNYFTHTPTQKGVIHYGQRRRFITRRRRTFRRQILRGPLRRRIRRRRQRTGRSRFRRAQTRRSRVWRTASGRSGIRRAAFWRTAFRRSMVRRSPQERPHLSRRRLGRSRQTGRRMRMFHDHRGSHSPSLHIQQPDPSQYGILMEYFADHRSNGIQDREDAHNRHADIWRMVSG